MTMNYASPAPAVHPVRYQSKARSVLYPGATVASRDLGCHRSHLHRVLSGERRSPELLKKWKNWLKANPGFAKLNRKARKG